MSPQIHTFNPEFFSNIIYMNPNALCRQYNGEDYHPPTHPLGFRYEMRCQMCAAQWDVIEYLGGACPSLTEIRHIEESSLSFSSKRAGEGRNFVRHHISGGWGGEFPHNLSCPKTEVQNVGRLSAASWLLACVLEERSRFLMHSSKLI